MPTFRNTLFAALALAYTTSAIPLAVDVNKRAAETNTVTETVWVTVDTTTTVWIEPTGPAKQAPAAAASTTAAPVVQPIVNAVAAPQPPSAATPSNSPAAFVEQLQPQPAPSSTAAAYVAPAPAAAAPPASSSLNPVPKQASSGGPCEGAGSGCSGDVTYYEGGLGACGWNVNTASDMSIALPHGLMGTQSNGNPYCGRSLSIKATDGSIVSATVGDKCMGCEGDSIDLTDALFKKVAPNGDGRVKNIEWWFN